MPHDRHDQFREGLTRRTLLKRAVVGAAALLGGSLYGTATAWARRGRKADTPLRHVIISCQENRSFDHYFGYASQGQGAGFGPPAGDSPPHAAGGPPQPLGVSAPSTPGPPPPRDGAPDAGGGGA